MPKFSVNHRRYPRIRIPTQCWSSRFGFGSLVDISLGGMRAYIDEWIETGEQMLVTLLLPGDFILSCTAKTVWLTSLPNWASAKYDIGFQFLDLGEDNFHRLTAFLAQRI